MSLGNASADLVGQGIDGKRFDMNWNYSSLVSRRWHSWIALGCVANILLLGGCLLERDTVVSIAGSNPPTFRLKGSGYQDFFGVREFTAKEIVPLPERPVIDTPAFWEIWPPDGPTADQWPPVKYGQVPSGFKQKIPKQGEPPPLEEGKMYEAGGPASNANGGSIWFKIQDGKSVEIPKPGGR